MNHNDPWPLIVGEIYSIIPMEEITKNFSQGFDMPDDMAQVAAYGVGCGMYLGEEDGYEGDHPVTTNVFLLEGERKNFSRLRYCFLRHIPKDEQK